MNKTRHFLLSFGVATLVVVTWIYGDVRAQESTADVGVDVTVRSDRSMSGQEQIAWVKQKTIEARSIANRVQSMLDLARKEKDPIKITALNDILTQIHVNLKGIEERTRALEIAVQAGDTVAANQHFTILKIYISRIEGLRAEAENSVGEGDIVLGETENILTIDDNVTPDDPSEDVPIVDDIGTDPFPHASGYY
ncbi:MAG: hypothetical protein GY847_41255 [Proteobacteria bacterium]|nr:hypothetical protein [Pseudomonadota bacterium]